MEKFPNATGKPKINVSFRLTRSGLVEVDKVRRGRGQVRGGRKVKEDNGGCGGKGKETERTSARGEEVIDRMQAEVAIEEMVEVETCETIKPPAKNSSDNSTSNETAGEPQEAKEAKEAGESGEAAAANKTEEEGEKRVCKVSQEKRVRRVALVVAAETPVPRPFTSSQVRETKKVLEDYDERERRIRERASAFNALESYIYTTKEKLESNPEMREVTTESFRQQFTAQLDKMSSWLDEDGWEADTSLLRSKLAELTQVAPSPRDLPPSTSLTCHAQVGDPVFFRMKQAIERPVAVDKANKVSHLSQLLLFCRSPAPALAPAARGLNVLQMLAVVDESVKNLTKKMSWLNESHTQVVEKEVRRD
eukprot:765678-Hanusia_phi.AAC.1